MQTAPMHVVHIATELAPIAKAGGLGDAVYGLCKQLAKSGCHVEVILPKYDCMDLSKVENLKVDVPHLATYEDGKHISNKIWTGNLENLNLILIEPDSPLKYFQRNTIYGEADDADRFTFFATTAIEYLHSRSKHPHILHLHDWPTALCAVFHKQVYEQLDFDIRGIILSIHNMEHQGRCGAEVVSRLGLNGLDLLDPDEMGDPIYPDAINLLKGGILYADRLTVVSPTYCEEIKHTEKGFGLQSDLLAEREKLFGILNGIDYEYWNPETDPALIAPFSTRKGAPIDSLRAGKKVNKKAVQERLHLTPSDKPLICTISRLAEQKGPELIEHAIEKSAQLGYQFVLLGTSSSPEIQARFEALKKKFDNSDNVSINLSYDESLAHLIYAGSDAIFIPSLFEPCGLTQLIGMRYGCVPIARRTGGLADTVIDYKNGITFDPFTTDAVTNALERAISCYHDHPNKWNSLIDAGISIDWSWSRSADDYMHHYDVLRRTPV